MRGPRHFLLFLVCLSLPAFNQAWWTNSKTWQVTAKGCVKCYGEPMRYVKVKLMDKDVAFDDTMATGRADINGCFKLSGKGSDAFGTKPEPYIRVLYDYYGSYGDFEVERIFGINRAGKTGKRSYQENINFGTLNFGSIHCRAYVRFYDAVKEYKLRTGETLPFKLHVRTGVILHGGTPYATTNVIRIPKNYAVSRLTMRTARHELAHTIRHSYDGSFAHFLRDAAAYWYLRTHHCGSKTNHGYAFNEGWAQFYAGECTGNYGSSSTDYRYEGNVAKALRKLKDKCSASYKKMVDVLKENRRCIHSFASYRSYFHAKYNC